MKNCKLIIRDEVNVKFEGLDLDTRRALVKKFEYEIPGAKYLPSVRLGRWNGKISYFQLGGSTYINLLDEIIPVLEESGYDIELEDTRQYRTHFEFNTITDQSFSHKTWPTGHPIAGQPIVLRDYQVEIINNFLVNPQSIQEVATGAGKTIISAALSYCCESVGRTIVIVPNKSLVTQTEADYRNLGLDVGVYFGDRKEHGYKHTICTWQSLNNLLKNTKEGEADITIDEFIEGVVCVMVDEAHSVKSEALKTLLSGVMSSIPIRWGLTGTIPKDLFASQALFTCIGPVINKLKASELQEAGVLSQCHVNIVQMQDHAEFRDYQSELSHLLSDKTRLDTISKLVLNIVETGNTLILVDRVAAGEELVNRLPNSVFIRGKTKLKERKEEYDEVAISNDKIIVATYGVAAVGINIPRIFNLVLLEPGKSFVRVVQSIGRGIRKAEDKDFVQIWDVTSTCRFAKRHLTKRKEFYREQNYPYTLEKLEYK
jgi:superfamily II DNA or RNA helicase